MPEVSGFLASACPVARYIDDVIHWLVQFSLVLFLFSPPPHLSLGFVLVVAVFFSPLMFLSVTGGAGSFPFVWGLMAELHYCASQGGIISSYGLAANSGSPWILQAPNLHFSDAVVNQWIVLSTFRTTGARCTVDVIIGNFCLLFYEMAESFLFRESSFNMTRGGG